MSHIRVLSPEVSTLIAAGEVVERPASVVKELVENSIDAGAKTITVEIEKGGVKYIRVTDDGEGIPKNEARLAFMRHATSKIISASDLTAIKTLGFRGEALASIAAVARVDILSRQKNELEGVHASAEGGEILESEPAGCPVGTTVTVKNLFYNTPARMKFLKRDATEAGYIEECLRRFALGRPDISIRYINDGKEVFFTPGDNCLQNAIHAVYGGDYAKLMLPVSFDSFRVTVAGMISKSELNRPNRSFQSFFVNGRSVSNRALYAAVAEGYKNRMMVGRFPVCVINITLDERMVDVNVHPSKTLIKFEDEKSVFDAVYWAVKNALNAPLPAASGDEAKGEPLGGVDFEKIMPQKGKQGFTPAPYQKGFSAPPYGQGTFAPRQMSFPTHEDNAPVSFPAVVKAGEGSAAPPQYGKIESGAEKEPLRIIGQVFGTYIIAQWGDEMLLIDQHAAHERLKFEEILDSVKRGGVKSQVLLMPEVVELSPVEAAIFSENKGLFGDLGFEIEEFGNNSVIVRMIPSDIEGAVADTVIEILDIIADNKNEYLTRAKELALYTIACKAAVKGNTRLEPDEQKALVDAVLALSENTTCPHGRPVVVRMTKYELEKRFKRVL